MTQSEFIKSYFRNNPEAEKTFNEMGQFACICECGRDDCKGWAMISKDSLQAQIDLYLKD